MVKRTGPTNYQVQQLITELQTKARESLFWKRILNDIQKPTRQRRVVNLYKIDQCSADGETIIVPGKVLSIGEINKKVNVAALNFSGEAKNKIELAKGKTLTITQLLKENPQGKKVRIIG